MDPHSYHYKILYRSTHHDNHLHSAWPGHHNIHKYKTMQVKIICILLWTSSATLSILLQGLELRVQLNSAADLHISDQRDAV